MLIRGSRAEGEKPGFICLKLMQLRVKGSCGIQWCIGGLTGLLKNFTPSSQWFLCHHLDSRSTPDSSILVCYTIQRLISIGNEE